MVAGSTECLLSDSPRFITVVSFVYFLDNLCEDLLLTTNFKQKYVRCSLPIWMVDWVSVCMILFWKNILPQYVKTMLKTENVHYKLCINYIYYIYKTWVQYKEGLKFGRYIRFVITM